MKQLNRTLKITLQGNDYQISFPTVGQIIEIESRKISLSNDNYRGLVKSSSVGAVLALDLIDSIATFSILIPSLREDLNYNSFADLDPMNAQEVIVVYKRVFLPWYTKWVEALKVRSEELSKIYEEPNKDAV